ncbi:hypothetical protein [Variovorax sp. 278MFTsu5.1]|uniref:hypothetical protein n=1 Tax=Variovorax sp. 278MFTsu5.1 TaxID=3158366 RepID=UPI003AAE16D6
MKIDERLQKKMEGLLRSELPKIRLSEGKKTLQLGDLFALDEKFSELIQKAGKGIAEQYEGYIGERSLVPVVGGYLYDAVQKIPIEEKIGKSFLCECAEFVDVEALAKRIVEMFVALPIEYVAAIKLPKSFSEALRESKVPAVFGRQLAIVGDWHEERQGLPIPEEKTQPKQLNQLARSFLGTPMQERDVVTPSAYLFLRVKGYIDEDVVFSRRPVERAFTLLKAFFGLAMGLEILNVGVPGLDSASVEVEVYDRRNEEWIKLGEEGLDHGGSQLISRLKSKLHVGPDISEKLRYLFSILDREDQLPQLVLAGRWFFDSHANEDPVMGFMQLAICAETLLGTEDGSDGITGVLASRCAYLIAASMKEREKLVREFKEIYKVRSKIVHRGLGAFRKSERQQFSSLRKICSRIIQKEVGLAMADEPEQQESANLIQALRSAHIPVPVHQAASESI